MRTARTLSTTLAATVLAIGLAAPVLAHGDKESHREGMMSERGGQAGDHSMRPGEGMGSGMMRGGGSGMMMGHGMMGHDHGMMGHDHGMMNQGTGMMHRGMGMMHGSGERHGHAGMPSLGRLLSTEDITEHLRKWVKYHVSERLTVTDVQDAGVFAARADVTTEDGGLVMRVVVDKRNGKVWRLD